ncbi:MAG: PAS domain S-box protein [Deltaproteobacteria bacterium]|nr:PAS domain S-box protein [Deltaproteobacteria bacterium]
MDRETFPYVYKALLGIYLIGIACLTVAHLLSHHVDDAVSRHLLWLQGFVVLCLIICAGAIVWHAEKHRRALQGALADKTGALKKSEEKYRSLLESAEDFIFTVDEAGCLLSLNHFTANFFGGTPSQFLGRPLSVLFPEEIASQKLELIRTVFQFGKSLRDEFILTMGDHHTWLSANFMPIKDEQEEVISILCIARDITEQKELENQLVNMEKLASMGTLAAGVAHELNNPLGVILGFTDLMLEKFDRDSQNYQDLKTIERHSLHCKQVVENLLSFARQGEGEVQYCDINEAIDEIVSVVKHSLEMNNIELSMDLGSGLSKVKGDLRQMQQVFLNLITNAAAAMPGGGVLEVKTHPNLRQKRVSVIVRDNGQGIRQEHMEKIFDPFFTTKSDGEGTGLGLFVSHGIITKYEGTITCESRTEEGAGGSHGTTFTVMLRAKNGGQQ